MINIQENKKCLECANSKCTKQESEFIYECCLSKKKCCDCLSEMSREDYFKEM